MAERKFLDCDGDTWTEYEPGWLRLTERANGSTMFVGSVVSIEEARDEHGPLTEIRPDVRAQVVADLRAKAARDWPGIGVFLEDIIAVVMGGVDGKPVEG
ncbi:hypothetical protein ACFCZT_24715 [Streptomyces sp. NPDC056230]|uniref:hypothetical protein n=1 Tax=Streptomyces sp. NPDC056230 TaxID=3345754 RepID=UPI0035D79413